MNTIKLNSGTYYVGDPGLVLPNDDLRSLFTELANNMLVFGERELISSRRVEKGSLIFDSYWIAPTPNKVGTIYDQTGKEWGHDWGCFGVVPWQWLNCKGTYDLQKITFNETFECSFDDKVINIGHLSFTYIP